MYKIEDIEYSCQTWREMSHNKYPYLTQHKRLSMEYTINKINFETINKDKDNDNDSDDRFIWGGW